jgi:tRNA pseudouridine55 synthase
MDGILNIYKEKGFTSHDVVAKLRGILKQKKIGHTGTLDPEAVGVLPICLGKATKICELLTDKDKTYVAVLKLGVVTDTEDMTGQVLSKQPVAVTKEEIEKAVASFVGEYDQIPPMYSALKVNGKRLYELAREGKEVERKPRRVHIYEITLSDFHLEEAEVTLKVHCSKGTYIRTLCADIGERLGCGGCMKSLIRTQVERFLLEDSLTLSQIEELVKKEQLDTRLISIETMFSHYRKIVLKKEADRFLYNGNSLWTNQLQRSEVWEDKEPVRVLDSQETFLGLYTYDSSRQLFQPLKMFL